MNDQEVLQLVNAADQAYTCKAPPGSSPDSKTTKEPHVLLSSHKGFEVWECEVNQKEVKNRTTYHYPAVSEGEGRIVGLLTLIRDGVITGTDVVSGHRIRRQAEGAVDPEKQLKDAEQKAANLSIDQKEALIAKLQAEIGE